MRSTRCNTVPTDPAICLICGTTCCMLSHCCTDVDANGRGECNMHTRECVQLCRVADQTLMPEFIFCRCGGVIGLYFIVKRCSLLYLYTINGSFTQSPYLDIHGEVDISMWCVCLVYHRSRRPHQRRVPLYRRGQRQYIHMPRWEEIRKTWLNHGIPMAGACKLESTVDRGGWEML